MGPGPGPGDGDNAASVSLLEKIRLATTNAMIAMTTAPRMYSPLWCEGPP
jgi:hypothetical protein